jgi:hypothetical protein
MNKAVTAVLAFVAMTAMAGQAVLAAGAGSGQSLDQAANDPTASLMSVQLQNVYAGDYHVLDGETGNTLLLRAAVPFKTGDLNHIARVTLPVVTDSPSRKSGLGDMVLFDLLAFDEPWGRWGIGPVLLAPPDCCGACSTRTCSRSPATTIGRTWTSALSSRSSTTRCRTSGRSARRR